MDLWAYNHHVQMDFNRRGKPTDNATVESFSGKFRDLLSAHLGAHFGVISGGGRRISGYFGGASSIKARV
jgi:transposase InsO family protein